MTVYYEIAVLDNLGTTLFISQTAAFFLKTTVGKLRLFFVCLISGISTIVFPFIHIEWYFIFALKILLGVALSAILFLKKKPFVFGVIAFFSATFIFGGALFAVGYAKYQSVADALTKPFSSIPIGIIAGATVVVFLLLKKIIVSFHRKFNDNQLIYDMAITFNKKEVKMKGFLDTGNRLFDPITGLPIVIISVKEARKFFDKQTMATMILNKKDGLSGLRYVSVGSITAENKILVFKPSEFKLYFKDKAHIVNDVILGISPAKINRALGAEAILHPGIF